MWYFIITNEGFQVFEILPDCVKPSRRFYAPTLRAALGGVLCHVRHAYGDRNVSVDIDNATFDVDGTMVGMVLVSLG